MADLKISEMTSASQINNDDNVELSQGNAQSGFASVKATILAIAQKIVTGINFTSALETESKTIAGAINEVAQGGGGSSTFAGLSDVDIDDTTLANGQVPKWNSTTEKWENGNAGGGSGGHTILDDSGTSLAQEDDLQFKGTYSEDDSTNGKTVVNITREMPQAQYDLLSANEKKGIIRITDDDYVCEGTEVKYSAGVSVKKKIDDYHDWQVVAQNVSTADISNTDFNEYNITVIVGGRTPAICYVFRLLRGSNLLSTNLKYIQGSWANGNYGTAVEILANTSSISISSVYINGTNELTNAKMYVVGRY